MNENITIEKLLSFKKKLLKNPNIKKKEFNNKEIILNCNKIKKQIGFITSGKATITKIDENGNTTIMRELKENDIFSNMFFQYSEDEIYIISNNYTDVIFIDYTNIIKTNENTDIVLFLYNLLIEDNRQQNEKIELLSKRTVREKILFFLKKRINKESIFKVTTSYTAIANYICVDRSNLMRELNKLEKENIIEKTTKTIKILK